MLQRVTAFIRDAISLTTGEDLACGENINIFSTLRREFSKWNVHLRKSGRKCECSRFKHSVVVIYSALKRTTICLS